MATANLTKRTIDALEFTPGCDYFVWDEKLKGFGIRVTERPGRSGQRSRLKVFVVGYRDRGSLRYRRVNLGRFGLLTAEQAREEALRQLGAVTQGADLVGKRKVVRGGMTVQELGVKFLDDVDRRRKRTTAREYRRLWEKHVVPAFGSKLITEVSCGDVRKLHGSLRKTPYVANRVVARLTTFFAFAIAEGLLPTKANPTEGIEFYPEADRERFLTIEEFERLGRALHLAETVGLPPAPQHRSKPKKQDKLKHRPKSADTPIPANPFAVAAIKALALTGCREDEILRLTRAQVDFERGFLRFDDSKQGKSVRPLGQSAAELLSRLPEVHGSPYFFPGRDPRKPLREIKRVWSAVRVAAKLEDVRLHDLRHSFASVPAAEEPLLVIGALLGHKDLSSTKRYAHLGDSPVKRAADKTARNISTWMSAR